MPKKEKKKEKQIINFQLMIPEGCEIGEIEVFEVDANQDIIGEFKSNKIEDFDIPDDYDSNDDLDYCPYDSEESIDLYEHLELTEEEKRQLKEELKILEELTEEYN